MDDFRPHASDDPHAEPQTPLSRAREWVELERGGRRYRRELNTMPQWAGSCWYYLRFLDARNEGGFVDPAVERYWMLGRDGAGRPKAGGVDLYMGGAEHAVLHLLYARFWHKVLYDLGHVSTPEPFNKLFNQGMIGAAAYRDERGVYAPAAEVEEGPEVEMRRPGAADTVRTRHYHQGRPVLQAFEKMSKSLKNVVNPDDILRDYGADTLRLYEMSMGPLEQSKPWNTRDIVGVHRFLQRVWRLLVAPVDAHNEDAGWKLNPKIVDEPASADPAADPLERLLHKSIKKVQGDIERFAFNTAIAQMIVWSNEAQKAEHVHRGQLERFLAILAPFAPHAACELAERLGGTAPEALKRWPAYDEALTQDEQVEVAVQINNKPCAKLWVAAGASDAEVAAAALAEAAVSARLEGRALKREPIVRNSPKGKLLNFVV
jgi:leucyl-tRNA synthetase